MSPPGFIVAAPRSGAGKTTVTLALLAAFKRRGLKVQAAKAGAMACVGVARLDDQALLKAAGADWVVASLDELPVATLLSDDKMTG